MPLKLDLNDLAFLHEALVRMPVSGGELVLNLQLRAELAAAVSTSAKAPGPPPAPPPPPPAPAKPEAKQPPRHKRRQASRAAKASPGS